MDSSSVSFGKMVSIRGVRVNGCTTKNPEIMYKVAQALSHLMQKEHGGVEIKRKMAQIMPDYFIKEGWQPVSVMRLNQIDKKVNLLTGAEAFARRNIYRNSSLSPKEKAQRAGQAIAHMIKHAYQGHIAIEAEKTTTKINGKTKDTYKILNVHKTV